MVYQKKHLLRGHGIFRGGIQKQKEQQENKEDARALNHFLDAMASRINQFKMDLIYNEKSISSQRIIDFVLEE